MSARAPQPLSPATTYRIYAAPRAIDGRYRLNSKRPLYRIAFETQDAMQRFWQQRIVPHTDTTTGLDYEIAMIVQTHSHWSVIDTPRYAIGPVFSKQRPKAGQQVIDL